MPKQPATEKWLYFADLSWGQPNVTKVHVRETPKQYQVLDYLMVYGTSSFTIYKGRRLRKERVKDTIFPMYLDALLYLEEQLTDRYRRQATELGKTKDQRVELQSIIVEILDKEGAKEG